MVLRAFVPVRRLMSVLLVVALMVSSFSLQLPVARAAGVTVECSGTSGSPTAVTEADLAGVDVLFSDTGGDGYCVLDEAISAASVVIGTGVVLVHTTEDVDGVTITTTGLLTVTGDINATGRGCAGGATGAANGRGPDLSTGACQADTAGYGDGVSNTLNKYGGGGDYGGAGAPSNESAGGSTYGSNTAPSLLGSGGGAGNGSGTVNGGGGGGFIKLDVSGTLTVSGSILADGRAGGAAVNGGGGGSGGAIYIKAATIAGSGAISADGGDGGNSTNTNNEDGAGGGGGRIAIYYDTNSSYDFAVALAAKGLKGSGAALANDGKAGTTFILNRKTDDGVGDLRITSGLNLSDGTDFSRTNITIDSGATVSCDAQTTLNFTASNNFTDNGATFNCSSAITTLNISAGATLTTTGVTWTISSTGTVNLAAATWTSSGTNALTFSKDGSTMDWAVTNALTLNNFTITGPSSNTTGTANTGVITMNNAIAVSLVSTTILAGVEWTDLSSLNIDASSSINATGKGCAGGTSTGANGYGPDASTGICEIDDGGYGDGVPNQAGQYGGGGAYGGDGGASSQSAGGGTYGTDTAPTFLGSGGGGGAGTGTVTGGSGGGRIRLDVDGTLTLSGSILADGGVGGVAINAAGGGSGGSIYITTDTIVGGGTVSADGGAGGDSSEASKDGAGGGGGRIAVYFGTNSSTFLADMTAANSVTGGATAGSGGLAGSNGTLQSIQYVLLSSAVTSVDGSGSTVNRLTITFNQNVDIVDGSAENGLDVITLASSAGSCSISNSDYAASSTMTLVLTVSCIDAAANNTAITISPTYTTAGSNEIHGTTSSTEVSNGRTVVGTDGAAPAVVTKVYEDSDANGTVERLAITLSETAVTQTAVLGDFVYVANDITSSALTGGTLSYPSGTTVRLVLGTAGGANITGHTTAPTLAYTDGGSTAIADAAGNQMATFTAAALSDGAAPVVTSRRYEDDNSDGRVDQLKLGLSEAATTQTAVLGDFTYVANNITGSALAGGTLSYPTTTAILLVLGTAGNTGITGHTTAPTLAYTDGGSTAIADSAGNQLVTYAAAALSDRAAPVFVSAAATSSTNARATMSEAISAVVFGAAAGWTSTGFTSSAVAINGDTTKLDVTVSTISTGFTSSNFAFTAGVSGSVIRDASSNETASFASKTISDSQAPSTPGSFGKASGSGTTAVLTWTVTDDINFNHYEIWYGTNSTDVTNRNGTVSEWDNDPNDATLGTRTTSTTTVTGLTPGSTYYALICAVDNASNESCSSNATFVTNQAPTVATVTGAQVADGSGAVIVSFIMDDPDDDNTLKALVQYSTDGGSTWAKATLSSTVIATFGSPTVDNSNDYQVGTGTYILSSSGANTIGVTWNSATDVPAASVENARVRVTPYDMVAAGTVASSSNFVLDNVDPSAPGVTVASSYSGDRDTYSVTIRGTKAAGSLIKEGVTTVVAASEATEWSYAVTLRIGVIAFSFTQVDASGNASTATTASVTYIQEAGTRSSSSGSGSSTPVVTTPVVTAVPVSVTTTPVAVVTTSVPTTPVTTVAPGAGSVAGESDVEESAPLGALGGESSVNVSVSESVKPPVVKPLVVKPPVVKPLTVSVDQIVSVVKPPVVKSPVVPIAPIVLIVATPTAPLVESVEALYPVSPAVPSVKDLALQEARLLEVKNQAKSVVENSVASLEQQKLEEIDRARLKAQLEAELEVKFDEVKIAEQAVSKDSVREFKEKVARFEVFSVATDVAGIDFFDYMEAYEPSPLNDVPIVVSPSSAIPILNPAVVVEPNVVGVALTSSTSFVVPQTRLDILMDAKVSKAYGDVNWNEDDDLLPDWWEEKNFGSSAVVDQQSRVTRQGLDIATVFLLDLDPTTADTDGDGVSDVDELKEGLNPTHWDSRGDGMSDKEKKDLGLSLRKSDTDGDGYADSVEIAAGSDPKSARSLPKLKNNMPVKWAEDNGLDLKKYDQPMNVEGIGRILRLTPSMTDTDGDGLSDADELRYRVNPNVSDSDGDGVSDYDEIYVYKTSPREVTATKQLYRPRLSNIAHGAVVFSDAKPSLVGTAQPNRVLEVLIVPKEDRKLSWFGLMFASVLNLDVSGVETIKVSTDSNGKFLIQPTLADGDYTVILRVLNEDGKAEDETLPYQFKVDTVSVSDMVVTPLQLDLATIDLFSEKRLLLENYRPSFYGKVGRSGVRVEVNWRSSLIGSSVMVDSESGEFVVMAPLALESGDHSVFVYAVDPVTQNHSQTVEVPFSVR